MVVESAVSAPPLTSAVRAAPPSWSLPRRLLFRLGFVYWVLLCVPILCSEVPGIDFLGQALDGLWKGVAVWVGHHVVGVHGPIATEENGSGDKTVDYLVILCIAVAALVATLIWSLLARRRREHERLHAFLIGLVRYTLALVMLGYGTIKLVGMQFPFPDSGRLLGRYGDSSPMGLLWTFVGASPTYQFFGGAGETLGAVLLLFRRTKTLGAIVLAFVLTNVVMMNFCYDVPVKINSSHYLAMCVFLILPDLRRLANVLVFNRPAEAAPEPAPPARRWMRIGKPILKYGVLAVLLGLMAKDLHDLVKQYAPGPRHFYDDVWDVEGFARDGREVPPLTTDGTRWKRVTFESSDDTSYVRWRAMDESVGELYTVIYDPARHTMTWTSMDPAQGGPSPPRVHVLQVAYLGANRLTLEGRMGDDDLSVRLVRVDLAGKLLVARGFHWVNELPFNR
jgi:hypothetical protein